MTTRDAPGRGNNQGISDSVDGGWQVPGVRRKNAPQRRNAYFAIEIPGTREYRTVFW